MDGRTSPLPPMAHCGQIDADEQGLIDEREVDGRVGGERRCGVDQGDGEVAGGMGDRGDLDEGAGDIDSLGRRLVAGER